MNTFLQDIRYAFRMLLKKPAFTAVALVSIALGIGANTAIFSLVNAVLLRPLPYPDADRLVMVWEDYKEIGFPRNTPAPANYVDWKTQNRTFEDMAAASQGPVNITGDGEPERVDAYLPTANFFQILGVKPLYGRVYTAEEDQPGSNRVAVMSYWLWHQRYGGDPQIVGKQIVVNDQPLTVIGVMPAQFQFPTVETALWIPPAFTPQTLARRGAHFLNVVGKLKPGVTVKQANADIQAITANIVKTYPGPAQGLQAFVLPMRDQFADTVSKSLIVLLAAVGCVLLVACANIANLLLARAAARNREIAVRTALGANRGRIVRQLLTESVLMAGIGAVLGIGLAQWSFVFLKKLVPADMTAFTSVKIDPKVFAFTLALSLITGIAFGLAPALHASRLDLNESLKQAGGRSGIGVQSWLRNSLVIAEVALSLVLLVGAGLMIKTIMTLQGVYSGFSAEQVLTVRTDLPSRKYAELQKRANFYKQVIERVKVLPGVVSVGYTTSVPLVWRGGTNGFEIEGKQPQPGMDANHRQISPDYFRTMSIPMRAGRTFNEFDGPDNQLVAIINETMAKQFWPGENPLNAHFKFGEGQPWLTVVGIVGDVKQMGLDVPVKAEMYFPYQQDDQGWCAPRNLAVRTTGDPKALAAAVTQAVWSVDKDQSVSNIRTMQEILDQEVSPRSTQMWLMTSFAILALLLASIGIYGVLSFAVAQRIPEIGVRMALGATQGNVLRMIVGQGMLLAAGGVGIGLVAAFLLTRLMSGLLYGVSATDPMTFGVVVAVLASVSLLACFIPARRATKVDPMVALRYE